MQREADIHYLESVDSTNTYAADHFDSLNDGALVVAETQSSGHGRLGRKWHSPRGNIYASFVMKDLFGEPFHATMVSSLAVLAVLNDLVPGHGAYVKWPNDIFIGDRKLSGVLCEGVIRKGALTGIICGIGVNVNLPEEELNRVGQPATSLFAQTKCKINLKNFAEKLAVYLNWYYIIGINDRERLFGLWKRENRIIGRRVMLQPPDGDIYEALVKDISDDGKLRIEEADGSLREFACGDVKLLPGQTQKNKQQNNQRKQDMILDGIKLMVLGMGTVLVFLIVMIFFMNLLAKVLAPFAGVLEKAAPAPKKKAAAKKSGDDSLKAAAAAAALQAYQSGK